MTGRVKTKTFTDGATVHYEEPWPESERCDWCFGEEYFCSFKNRAELVVGSTKLCLLCWFDMAFGRIA